jgi:putative membrane-bound dehydrogenase-like protein
VDGAKPFWDTMSRFLVRFGCTILLTGPIALHAAQYRFATQTLTVPDGFEVEQVAGPPLVDRPISGAFDEQGRLYLTDSSGSNDKVEKQLAEKPHRVMRLEPANEQGKFTKSAVFAEHMMFPEGCLWFDGSLYVSAPPSIWKLTDTNNDGLADEREEWHQGKTLTGCANDLHGPYLGLDGWIYWCKGAIARQTYERPGRKPLVTRASHIFRAPPDHSDLEPVLTAGMDNPVGVVFLPNGERFMCGTFLMHPEAGKRDGIVHAVYGGVYGKSNDVTDDHPKTGDLMPIMTHLGAAAPCSVIRYQSEAFGEEYRDSLFVCCFNLHKVTRHVLVPDGATFKTKDTDFVVSDNTDFHPTDVIEDADGSLLVVDTGGWYKLCCPTSQLSKPDVLGAVYRIRRTGAQAVKDPRGLGLAWGQMQPRQIVELLADGRPAVRKCAIQELAKLGTNAVAALTEALNRNNSTATRQNTIWALTRISGEPARSAVRATLADRDEQVVHAAIHSVSLWRDAAAESQLLSLVQSANPQLQRAAAEALGRIGAKSAVPSLLEVSAKPHDRVLEHSLTFALIETADAADTTKGVEAASPYEKRTALIALDQMEEGTLQVENVAPLLSSNDALLRQTAAWIASHHPGWGDALAGYFRDRLLAADLAGNEADDLKQQLAQFAGAKAIQQLMTSRLSEPSTPVAVRRVVLDAISAASLKQPPAEWAPAVAACLRQREEDELLSAVATARVLSQVKNNPPNFSEPLMALGRDPSRSAQLRLEALAALRNGLPSVEPELLTFLCASVAPDQPVQQRSEAADVLARAALSDDELLTLAATVKTVGPLEMTRLLGAFDHCTNATVGLKLVDSLRGAKGLASLRPDVLEALLAKYPEPVREHGKDLLALLDIDRAKQSGHLEELLRSLKKGDIRRGQAIFNSPRAACSSCHAMGYLGGQVGPDLTTIGQTRTEKDLLESIVYPSASFVRSFEPVIVRTKSDDEYNGVLRKDAPDEIVLATGPTTEVRLARSEIADMRPGTVSIMPAGLEQQLTPQELADLIAFLKATKWGAQ